MTRLAPATGCFQSPGLEVSTRGGCPAKVLIAAFPVSEVGKFWRCNGLLPSKLPYGLRPICRAVQAQVDQSGLSDLLYLCKYPELCSKVLIKNIFWGWHATLFND